jgi:hypothetical protein
MPTTLDARPFDDRTVRGAVARYDEAVRDGLLAGATGVELCVTTDELDDAGDAVVVDVLHAALAFIAHRLSLASSPILNAVGRRRRHRAVGRGGNWEQTHGVVPRSSTLCAGRGEVSL